MLMALLMIFVGLVLLATGADRFVSSAANTARHLGLSPFIIGLTVVGMATSAPEILVGSVAAWQGKTGIAIGNAIGSNIANIGLVLGLTVIFMPMYVASNTLKREFGLMSLAIAIALLLLVDQNLDRIDAAILLGCLLGFTAWIVWIAKKTSKSDPLVEEFDEEYKQDVPLSKSLPILIIGLVLLLGGAELLVRGSVTVAKYYGVPDLIIGLTIIAVGTSLPELAASITSIIKKEADIAIGNIIGSNMFNMLAVLGIPGMIQPIGFSSEVLWRDFPVMIGMTLLLGWMIFLHGRGRFTRRAGITLLACYSGYQYSLYLAATG